MYIYMHNNSCVGNALLPSGLRPALHGERPRGEVSGVVREFAAQASQSIKEFRLLSLLGLYLRIYLS